MLQKLTERIYYLPYERYRDRPNLGYIRGDKMALQVDAGSSAAHVKLMQDSLGSLPRPQTAVMTHAHWDHTYGIHAFPGLTVAGKATQAILREMAAWSWAPKDAARRIAQGEDMLFTYDAILKEYDDFSQITVRPADVTFEGMLEMDLGNCPIRMIPIENSHSADCVVIHIPTEGVVFLGDICYEDLLTQPPRYDKEKHQILTDALKALDFDLCVPGHHEVMTRHELFADLEEIRRSLD